MATTLFFAAFSAAHKVTLEEAVNQQEAQNKLVGTVVEYIKGMPVVKAFNLAGKVQGDSLRISSRLPKLR